MLQVDLDDALLTKEELSYLLEACKNSIAELPPSSCNIIDVLNMHYYEMLQDTIKTRHSLLVKELGISHWLSFKNR